MPGEKSQKEKMPQDRRGFWRNAVHTPDEYEGGVFLGKRLVWSGLQDYSILKSGKPEAHKGTEKGNLKLIHLAPRSETV